MSVMEQLQPDIIIAGAGIIGLTLALELHTRGARVTVLEAVAAIRQASFAAAGMLAAHDPHNPPALLPLAKLSLTLYPAFLARLHSLSGLAVPFQTESTVQHLTGGATQTLSEHSLDPRQLAEALLAAVRNTSIDLREHTGRIGTVDGFSGMRVRTADGLVFHPKHVLHATGAWFNELVPVTPRKGQMLRVALPPKLRGLCEVHRAEHIYVVPRTKGPQAGTAILGATVEDAGFDTKPHQSDLAHLRTFAADLLPALGSEADAPQVEAWAGLRPATPDSLPILGPLAGTEHQFVATGHYRNGILLAPATAQVMADLLEGKQPGVSLAPFTADRFRTAKTIFGQAS